MGRTVFFDTMSDPRDTPTDDLPEQLRVRREKLDRIRERGVDPYPVTFERTDQIEAIRAEFGELGPGTETGKTVSVAGRVILYRTAGKLCFATIRDGSGDIQVMLAVNKVGEESLESWKKDVDLGDHIGVTGEVITSKRGELSVMAESWVITAKTLRPLPEKHHGLTDPEARVRRRYVDLIVNAESRSMVHTRAAAIQSLRDTLNGHRFVEVETPMLIRVHGGANARPFVTHINAYDMELFLRIAPELWLKRLLVGGLERVYEINRNFRNEGADSTHNPEFTMLEFYATYTDYNGMAKLTQELIQRAALASLGTTVIERDGHQVDIGGDWPSVTLHGAVSEVLDTEITAETPVEHLRKYADARGVSYDPKWGPGKLVEELFEALVESNIVTPTFVRDYPVETSPLTRQHRDNPLLTEKWDLIGWGMELGTAFSELTDPAEQRRRFLDQALLGAAGDEEAMRLDEDFLEALEYGMPPAGGVGVGIDRLLMAFTGKNIRETILFPIVKPNR